MADVIETYIISGGLLYALVKMIKSHILRSQPDKSSEMFIRRQQPGIHETTKENYGSETCPSCSK